MELNLVNQSLNGTLLANETESVITIKTDKGSAKNNLRQANGKGSIYNR